jgi:hypothetical protein
MATVLWYMCNVQYAEMTINLHLTKFRLAAPACHVAILPAVNRKLKLDDSSHRSFTLINNFSHLFAEADDI